MNLYDTTINSLCQDKTSSFIKFLMSAYIFDIGLFRVTIRKAPKIRAFKQVRIILVTLAVRESNLIASRILIFASFGVIHLARLYLASLNFTKIHQKLNCREVRAILTKQIFSRTRLFSKVI